MSTKTFFTNFIWIALLTLPVDIGAQSCITSPLTLTSQAQIDAFPTNYPGCVTVQSSIVIEESTPGNITNLSGLSQLVDIQGILDIQSNNNLTSLSGLGNLTTVELLRIQYNNSLTSLSGLNSFSSCEGISIDYNPSLLSLSGLDNVTTISGTSGLNGLTLIGNNQLNSLSALSNVILLSALALYDNPNLSSLAALSGVNDISEDLIISNNLLLTNLTGLDNLTSIGGGLSLSGPLTSISALSNITSLGGYVEIFSTSLNSLTGLLGIANVSGSFYIGDNSNLTTLSGLENIVSTNGKITIEDNNSLISLDALSNFTSINGGIVLRNNPSLSDISGLSNIDPSTINEPFDSDITILNNTNLGDCAIASVCAVLGIDPAQISLFNNATGCNNTSELTTACASLPIIWGRPLSGLASIGEISLSFSLLEEINVEKYIIEHSLDGTNFQAIGELKPYNNRVIENKYSFIHTNPNNGTNHYRIKSMDFDGKYSYSNIASAFILNENANFKIYPNPARSKVTIVHHHNAGNLYIYDSTGQLVLTSKLENENQNEIDFTSFKSGIYILKMNNSIHRFQKID